jgi:hypothetical protein
LASVTEEVSTPSVAVVQAELKAVLAAFDRYKASAGHPGSKLVLEALVQSMLAFAEAHRGWRRQTERTEAATDGS